VDEVMSLPTPSYSEGALSSLLASIAMEDGLCRPSEVVDALCLQEEMNSFGVPPERFVRVLLERGRLDPSGVARLLARAEERVRVLELPGFKDLVLVSRDATTLLFWGMEAESRRSVAVQMLRFSLAESREHVDRFAVARRSRLRLAHENLVAALGGGEVEGTPYVVLERVTGPDLLGFVEERGPLSEARGLEVLRDAASGLAHAHALDIVHGALSPGAVFLPRAGGARVGEFPLFAWPPVPREETLPYLAPEQVRESDRPLKRGDLYSLGAVMYHALTGRPPFRGRPEEITRQHLKKPAPDPRVLVPGLGSGVSALVLRLLEKHPERRPASMAEVAAAAGECLNSPRASRLDTVRSDARYDRILSRRSIHPAT
jgi:serine/threonine protein kinase